MNRYSRVLHHIDIEDVKLKCLDEIAAREIEEKNRKFEEEYIAKKMESWGYDWRKDLAEQMTTAGAMSYLLPAGEDTEIGTIDTATVDSFTDGVDNGLDNMMFRGVNVKSSGTGTGEDGGFDIGTHLAFNADTNTTSDGTTEPWSGGNRHAILKAVDASNIDQMVVTAIRGNDSNGGEDPDVDNEELKLMWFNKDRAPKGYWQLLSYDQNADVQDVNDIIIPLYDGQYPGLRQWTIDIPTWARNKDQQFMLYQQTNSGREYDHYGITNIQYRRKTPKTVFVSLDSPEASVFVRVGQGSGTTSPKKRKKRVQDILASGKKYTTTNMGPDFPGSNARLDDPQMPHKQVADIQQANRDGVSDRASDLWGEKDGYSFDPPGTELPIADKNILSPEHLKRLNGPGRTSVTVNGKTYRKFEDLPTEVTGPAYEAFYAWRDALDKDVTKQQNELIIAAGYGWTLPSGNKYGKATYINFGGYDPGTPEYALGQSISKLNKDAMDLSNERFREMSQRIVEIDSDGNPVTSDAGADTDIEGEESTDAEGSEEKKIVGELEADPKSDASQEGIKNILANQLNKPEMANFWEKLGKAGETFARHLTNTLPSTVDNNYLGKKYVNSAFNKASFNVDGTLDMGDNIMGTTQPPTYDSRSKEVVVPFNYDFTPNAQEFQKNKGQVNMLQKVVYTGLGKYSVDASPKFGSDPLSKVVGMGLGAVFSKSITGAETFGGGKHVPGEVRMSINDLKRTNAPLYAQMMARGVIPDPVKEKRKSKVTESVSMKKKLKTAKEFFKQADIRPTFPENPPPELDPKTGMHPNYGKQAGRYKKLDPLSAKAMPKTVDQEIDAEVEKAKKKPK